EKIESIEVFDLFGKSLIRLNSVSNESQVDLSRLTSGNYIIQAKFETRTVQRKISIY
ncbi:MAG: T9SS type A sorting domain-containing protein, partial [Bacteroidetes bacterium]|nr:T9SS type A sorting domain-containing protein [Bacteroidota bacterium]